MYFSYFENNLCNDLVPYFKSRIVAFDKISSKIDRMKLLCDKLDAKCVECLTKDATKIGK